MVGGRHVFGETVHRHPGVLVAAAAGIAEQPHAEDEGAPAAASWTTCLVAHGAVFGVDEIVDLDGAAAHLFAPLARERLRQGLSRLDASPGKVPCGERATFYVAPVVDEQYATVLLAPAADRVVVVDGHASPVVTAGVA